MKSTWKRALSALLALIMVLLALTTLGCADVTTDEQPDDPGSTDTPEQPDTPDLPEEEPRIPLDYLPQETYGGDEIHILEWSANGQTEVGSGWIPWEEIDVEVGDGDPINNAIYDRNGVVEETYDVLVTKEYLSVDGSPAFSSAFRANEQSGDQAYQMITMRTIGISGFCMEGLMTNMFELPNLHTDMPWWNADSVRSYTMGNALFFAAPEMLLRDKGATAAMYYNHKVAADNEIEDLYALAESGEWTRDVMIELSEDVTSDMDGDDLVSSAEDMYGLTGSQRSIPYHMFAGSGNKIAVIDDEGYLELTFGDEDSILIWQDVLDYIMYSDFYTGNLADSKLVPKDFDFFVSDRALFYIDLVKSVLKLRNMTSDYGVLPIPKYDTYQEDYASLVWMHHDCVLGIPGSCTNTDVISAVLEHMSYISYYDVYPIFYDTIILGRSARDEQSKQMLEVIFKARSFDPGQYWLNEGTGSFLTMFEQKNKNISSTWTSIKTKTEKLVEDFNEMVDQLR